MTFARNTGSRCAVFVVLCVLGTSQAVAASTLAGTPTKRYVMTFLACDRAIYSDCDHPPHHLVYLVESDDGATWSLVPDWQPYLGSTPSPVRRGNKLYIFEALENGSATGHNVVRYDYTTRTWQSAVDITVSGDPRSNNGILDPTPILDDEGRIVLFYKSATAADVGLCNVGQTCTRYFHSATEVAGSDGTAFTSDSQPRVAWVQTPTSATGSQLAADVYVYPDGSQYVLYISGPGTNSITVWTSPTLRGTYSMVSTLTNGLLANGTGGVAGGYFDPSTRRYWSLAHKPQPNGIAAIRRAIHAGFAQQLTEADWTTVVTGSGLGLTATTSVESPGFADTSVIGMPSTPTNLAYTISGSTVTLTWTASTGAASYDVEVGSRTGATDLTTLSTTSATLSGAAVAGVYYVRVRGRNSSGTGDASNEVAITVGSCGAVSAPGPLSASVAGAMVRLVWGGVGGATSYVLEAGASPNLSDLANTDLSTTATSFVASGVPRGTYYVRVRSKNACSTSGPSNEVVVVVR